MTGHTTSRMLGATLVGGAVGAGLALLFAPASGKQTRKKLQQNVDDIKHDAHDKLTRVKDAAQTTGRKAKAGMEELRKTTDRKSRRQSPVLTAWEEEV